MRAIQVEEGAAGRLIEREDPVGDGILIDVAYSGLNYKDALAVTGRGKVLRRFPLVPGIDLAGQTPDGEWVLATGWGLGEERDGGYAERVRLAPADFLPLPSGLDAHRAMALGTAGLTSMLCVMAIEPYLRDTDRPVLVTGAGGGVGSIAVLLLSRLGHRVTAVSGRPALTPWLKQLGAEEVIARDAIAPDDRPMSKERWAGAIDAAGGKVLADVLRTTAYGGAVAACGLAGGTDLPSTVFPFILRGVSLLGIDSVRCPNDRRREAWRRLGELVSTETLDEMHEVIPLAKVPAAAERLLANEIRGRLVVKIAS